MVGPSLRPLPASRKPPRRARPTFGSGSSKPPIKNTRYSGTVNASAQSSPNLKGSRAGTYTEAGRPWLAPLGGALVRPS